MPSSGSSAVKPMYPDVHAGDVCNVFDAREWGGKDHPDGNERYFHPATVLEVHNARHRRDRTLTVRFHHDGRVSRGHLTTFVEVLNVAPH
jgi:hypothetical protein